MGVGLLNQNSGLNILAGRPAPNVFSPAPRRQSMNDDLNNGGTFTLTEPPPASRTNFASPDRASAMNREAKQSISQAEMLGVSAMSLINTPQPQAMVSFNFLTQVPIEDFVIQEHQKASKMSARLKSNASMKIERELQRKIREKEQKARLDKVLNNAQLKLKTDVEILKKREEERHKAVEEKLQE